MIDEDRREREGEQDKETEELEVHGKRDKG